ncbi:hypothetical protein [Desulfoferula mesophila]|uniref:Uncharacterized protein n=1 Tax=Desulfoferula mesophila TaxID=3058419 RepID=A0AAU9EKZ7_9BACT|nr:hypothetical protein FAK_23100 [Desulfoferula mesophilus]
MLLIIALLDIIHLATIDEVFTLLKNLSISIEKKAVERYLSLLVSLELIIKKPYRNYIFYLPTPSNPWLSFSFTKVAQNRDIVRWKSLFSEEYRQSNLQKERALRSYFKSHVIQGT